MDLPAVSVAGNDQINPGFVLGVGTVGIVGKDDLAVVFRDVAEQVIERDVILPVVPSSGDPNPFPARFDHPRRTPHTLTTTFQSERL